MLLARAGGRLVQRSVCVCLFLSAGEGAGDHQVLPVLGEARRLGVGAELRNHRAQQSLFQAALHRQRQLRPHVSASAGGPLAYCCRRPRSVRGGVHCARRLLATLGEGRWSTLISLFWAGGLPWLLRKV